MPYKKVYFSDLIQHKTYVFAVISTITMNFGMYFQLPLMNKMFVEVFEITPDKSNLFWLISGLSFAMFTPLSHFLLKRKLARRRMIMFIGLTIVSLSLTFRSG